jgi:Fic family protein
VRLGVYPGDSLNFKIPLTKETLAGISRIDQHRALWSAGSPVSNSRLSELAEITVTHSTAAASRLAGLRVSDDEVGAILSRDTVCNSDERQVKGYANALRTPFAPPTRRLRPGDFAMLHTLSVEDPLAERSGVWRTRPLVREAFDASGRATGRVFSTLPPRQIEPRLQALTVWLERELRDPTRHPIPSIAAFSLGLLAASPFEKGNGRLTFLAMGHLLRRAGYPHIPYASLEARIEDARDEFQASFGSAQTRFWSGDATLEPWIEFFVKTLDRHREKVDIKIALEQRTHTLPPLQQAIIETVREHGTVGAGLLLQATGANRNTLKDNLRRMVDHGVLEKHGERRGTLYRLASPDPLRGEGL